MSAPIPEELIERLSGDGVVLVVGAGTSIYAVTERSGDDPGSASWKGLLEAGLVRLERVADPDEIQRARGQLRSDTADAYMDVADFIEDQLKRQGFWTNWLMDAMNPLPEAVKERGKQLYQAIARLRAPILTTNYDDLIEAFAPIYEPTRRHSVGGSPHAVSWRDDEALVNAINVTSRRPVVHLHGYFRIAESVIFSRRSYIDLDIDHSDDEQEGKERDYRERLQGLLESLYSLKTVLFVGVGAGLEDRHFTRLRRFAARIHANANFTHYQLCLTGQKDELAQRQSRDRDKIEPLDYGDTHEKLAGFLEEIARRADKLRHFEDGPGSDEPDLPVPKVQLHFGANSLGLRLTDGTEIKVPNGGDYDPVDAAVSDWPRQRSIGHVLSQLRDAAAAAADDDVNAAQKLLGGHLGYLLDREVRRQLNTSANREPDDGDLLALSFDDGNPQRMEYFPWEYLFLGSEADGVLIARRWPILRRSQREARPATPIESDTFRVLIAYPSAALGGAYRQRLLSESNVWERAWKRGQPIRCKLPRDGKLLRQSLRTAYTAAYPNEARPEVVHLIADARLQDGEPELNVSDSDDSWVKASDIAGDLGMHRPPRLMVLQLEERSEKGQCHAAVVAVARAFAKEVPNVIGIESRGKAADLASFVGRLYTELVAEKRLDQALQAARAAVIWPPTFGIPVVYVGRAHDGDGLPTLAAFTRAKPRNPNSEYADPLTAKAKAAGSARTAPVPVGEAPPTATYSSAGAEDPPNPFT